MKTSPQPTSASGAAESTSSQAAFLASPSVTPGSDAARAMTVTSGRICSAALTKSNPIGSLLRTLLESSRWSSKARFLRWQVQPTYSTRSTIFEDTDCARPLPCNASATTLKVTDMPSSRCLFRLVPLEHPTDATESSSSEEEETMLPTPQTQGLKVCDENGKTQFMDLSMLPQPFLKTPCAADSWSDRMESKGVSGTLAQEVVSGYAQKHRGLLLPTPLVVEREHPERVEALKATGATRINSRANGEQRPNGLIDFMQFYGMLPTPITRCWKGGSASIRKDTGKVRTDQLDTFVETLPGLAGGKGFRLSPLFTEEMMGFPLMWTTLPFLSASGAPKPSKPTATPSSRK